MKKLIITTSDFTGYSTLFDLKQDLAVKSSCIEMGDVILYNLNFLPDDVINDVFERVVFRLIKNGYIQKALAVLLGSNISMCRVFYCKYVSNIYLDRSQLIGHIISLFRFMLDISDALSQPGNEDESELYLGVQCINNSIDIGKDKLWPLTYLQVNESVDTILLDTHERVHRICTGPKHSDIIWVSGEEKKGIVFASLVKGPVLVLEFYRVIRGIEQTIIKRKTDFLKNVVQFLRLFMGSRCGVYTAFPIEGFTTLVSEV